MPATILTVSGDKRIDLSNSGIYRRPVYLNNWTTMRIGLHFCVPSAATIVGTPRIFCGMGNGLTNGIADSSTTNWIGAVMNTATWTRSILGSPAIAYTQNLAFRAAKRVATTLTLGGADLATAMVASLDATFNSIFLVEITKGSPNYTVRVGYPSSNSAFSGVALPGITETMMDAYMGLPATMTGIGSVSNPNYSTVSGTLAMDEVAGVLDTVQIYWDKTAAPLELTGVYHRKLA